MSQVVPDVALASPPPPARRSKLLRPLALAVTFVLGLVIAWQQSPREVGRWYLAAAAEHRLNADYFRVTSRNELAEQERQRADAAIAKAIEWYPDGGEIYLERAKWRKTESKYAEALADCDTALRLGVKELPVVRLKVELLAHLGRHSQAVKQAEIIYAHTRRTWWDPNDDANGLNAVAYFRALANEQLPQALLEVDRALEMLPANRYGSGILDTRGYVLHRMGREEEAMAVFTRALPLVQFEVAALRAGRSSPYYLDHREFAVKNPQEIRSMGVIYYHASLVLEKLNRWKEAKELRGKAKDLLGREPDETVF